MSSFSIDTIRDVVLAKFLSTLDDIDNHIKVTKYCVERITECEDCGDYKQSALLYFESDIKNSKLQKMILVGFKNNSPEKFLLKLKEKFLESNSQLLECCSKLVEINYLNEEQYLYECNKLKSHWNTTCKLYDILL